MIVIPLCCRQRASALIDSPVQRKRGLLWFITTSQLLYKTTCLLYKLTFFKVTQRRPVEILYRKDHLNEQQASKPNGGKGFHDRQWKLPPTKPFSISVFSTLVKQY